MNLPVGIYQTECPIPPPERREPIMGRFGEIALAEEVVQEAPTVERSSGQESGDRTAQAGGVEAVGGRVVVRAAVVARLGPKHA